MPAPPRRRYVVRPRNPGARDRPEPVLSGTRPRTVPPASSSRRS